MVRARLGRDRAEDRLKYLWNTLVRIGSSDVRAARRGEGTCLMMRSVCFAEVLASGSPQARYATCSTLPLSAAAGICLCRSSRVSNTRRTSWTGAPSHSSWRLWRRKSRALCATRRFLATRWWLLLGLDLPSNGDAAAVSGLGLCSG